MEQKVVRYRLWFEEVGDGTRRAWFKANNVSYSTVEAIKQAYPDANVIEDKEC